MASRKTKNYLAPLYNHHHTLNNNTNHFEFNEADIWSSSSPSSLASETKNPIPSRAPRKPRKMDTAVPLVVASSLPVNIPDWSKIMGRYEKEGIREIGDDYEDDDDDVDDKNEDGLENRLPPHEYVARKLARSRIGPFSVHEGVGRTLKGRDLSQVRNAVWKQPDLKIRFTCY